MDLIHKKVSHIIIGGTSRRTFFYGEEIEYKLGEVLSIISSAERSSNEINEIYSDFISMLQQEIKSKCKTRKFGKNNSSRKKHHFGMVF